VAGRVVVVGAGPCGLACARELRHLGHESFEVLEAADRPGGLSASVVDAAGFTWDRGGHVVFSHFGEFDRLLADVLGDDVERHERSSYLRLGGEWVPYPLQNNLHRLPPPLAEAALIGLIEAQHTPPDAAAPHPPDFASWMQATFGTGIVDAFMRPYNEKVWAQPAEAMNSRWMAERVSTVAWEQAVRSVVHRVDDEAWGPNSLFSFPREGGTGEIYRRAALAVQDRVALNTTVMGVDLDTRRVLNDSGVESEFEHLLWTGPLDRLVALLTSPVPADVQAAAGRLVHNSVTVVGIGYEAPLADERSWLYFPEADAPFYRATNFAKYAASNVPGGRTDRYSSWMTEIASSEWRPLDADGLPERVDTALRSSGLVPGDAPIASVHVEHLPYAYPVPSLGRDDALAVIQPWLAERGVLARGRFGAWRYELGNMDHAVKMGIDVARRIVLGRPEEAWSL
jgi:protoporphyrinogen oxidase